MKIKIDYKSFFQRGVPSINEDFFIRLITGYQGSGKSYLAIKLVSEEKNRKVKTNIMSYKQNGKQIEYFEKLEEIINDEEDNVTYVIDELSKRYSKNTPQDNKFYSWLQQSRKHNRHVYLITQEYLQVPTWLRGIANTIYTTSKVPVLPIYKTQLGVPVLDDTFEWSILPICYLFYKRTRIIANLYNTREGVPIL